MPHKLVVDTRVTVETPEGVDFQFRIAGPGTRGLAFLIDTGIKVGVVILMSLVAQFISVLAPLIDGFTTGSMLLVMFVLNWLYSASFESLMNGQTPGKWMRGLRVVRTNGTPITFFEAFGRNLLATADAVPIIFSLFTTYLVSMISMTASPRMQRIGDLVFDTMVIDESLVGSSKTAPPECVTTKLLRSECSRRFHVPERTLAVIEELFEEKRLVSHGRREELALVLVPVIMRRLGYVDSIHKSNASEEFAKHFPATHFLRRVLATFRPGFDAKQPVASHRNQDDASQLELSEFELIEDSTQESPLVVVEENP